MFDKMKKVLGISFLVLLLTSMMVAVVSAQDNQGDQGGAAPSGSDQKMMQSGGGGRGYWYCTNPYMQQYYTDCKQKWMCERGHWDNCRGQRVWKCDSGQYRYVCTPHRAWACYNWKWCRY